MIDPENSSCYVDPRLAAELRIGRKLRCPACLEKDSQEADPEDRCMQEHPNILWLTCEDTSPQFVSCYGKTPVTTTPNIDALAAEGVRFDNAYATAPVCSASRSAIITGVCNEATGLGHHRSKYALPEFIRGFPAYLREGAGYYATNNAKTDYNIEDEQEFIDKTWDESSTTAHWRNRPAGKPFFSVFNYMNSHQSRTMTLPWNHYRELVLDALEENEVIPEEAVEVPPIYRDNAEMKHHLSRVYNSLKRTDLDIAERLAELKEDGLAEDTIVFFFADHGEGIPRGKMNSIAFGYRAAFVAYFPEKYKHLSPWGTRVVTDELISFEDLAPTVLSLAGVEIPGHMTGRAFLGSRRADPPEYIFPARNRIDDGLDLSRSAISERFVYTRNFFPHFPVSKLQKYCDVGGIMRTIRRDYSDGLLNGTQAELVEPTRPLEVLYDLKNDPWETNNLAGDPAHSETLRRLRKATLDHVFEIRDVMFLNERYMIGQLPYAARQDRTYNPLEELVETASLIDTGGKNLPELIGRLDHPHEQVRYMAAAGIYAARNHISGYARELADQLENNPPCVLAELAPALYGAVKNEKARDIIAELILGDDEIIAHSCVAKLLYIPGAGGDFKEAVAEAWERLLEHGERPPLKYYPLFSSLDVYQSVFMDRPLYYPEEAKYCNRDEMAPLQAYKQR